MYILMYAIVNHFENVFHNVNQVYMAGLMAAPILDLCKPIVSSQQSEIAEMKRLLEASSK